MTFGEKVKSLRTKLGLNQEELAKKIGVTTRAVCSYENENSRPRGIDRYKKLAEVLDVNVNYLLSEDEEFVASVEESYGRRGARQAQELVSEISGLFAGGELSEKDKDAVMRALQDAYWKCKEENVEKYTPKKYRK